MDMTYGGLNLHKTELEITAGLPGQLIKGGMPQVAFSGRSNVGKSSLINSLLGRKKLARVSSEPGKTITVNYYCVDKSLMLVDLPGYGFAKRPKQDITKWSSMTDGYFMNNDSLKLVLQLVDIRIGLTEDDRMMLDYLEHFDIPYIVVATKCDKLGKTKLKESVDNLMQSGDLRPGSAVVLYSSVTGEGRDALWNVIVSGAFGE